MQVISTKGIKWQKRFVVLSKHHVAFSKQFDANGCLNNVVDAHISTNELWEAFDKRDEDKDG